MNPRNGIRNAEIVIDVMNGSSFSDSALKNNISKTVARNVFYSTIKSALETHCNHTKNMVLYGEIKNELPTCAEDIKYIRQKSINKWMPIILWYKGFVERR